ncbi:PASTA domain-containing protein [Nonomuraea antimicrobica]
MNEPPRTARRRPAGGPSGDGGDPPLTGLDKGAAGKAVKRAGLVLGPVTEVDAPQKVGQVLSAEPAPGTVVNLGSTVSLQVSAGLAVPALTGMRREPAEAALVGAGLKVGAITRSCAQAPTGQVLSTQPKAGSRVTGGAAVALTLSRNGTTVPSVVGRPREDARVSLMAAGFVVAAKEQLVDDEAQVGSVLAQSLEPGTCAKPGAQIVITIGLAAQSGPDPHEPIDLPTGPIVTQ